MTGDLAQSLLVRARDTLRRATAEADVEGYLCAVLLRGGPFAWLTDAVKALRSAPAPAGLVRSKDVAVVGLRHALGLPPGDLGALATAVRRELTRQPLPPARRAHDDERLMLGLGAAVGAVPGLRREMALAFAEAEQRAPRWAAVADIARWLASGTPDDEMATATAALVSDARGRSLGFGDAAPLLWLGAEVIEARSWHLDDASVASLDEAIRALRQIVVVEAPDVLEPLDAAMVLRGLAVVPSERFARRSVLAGVVAAFRAFPTVAQILAQRPRGREGIALLDEYEVQWLAHALLVPVVEDLVAEDPAPKLAGHSSRLDFTSRGARLGIEIKVVRSPADVAQRRKEIMIDERQYQEHPYVETVVVFVHDMGGHVPLAERAVFERDLSGPVVIGGRTVRYVTMVR